MITLSLDHHDLLFAVEGFARGSHLRQHVWEQIVYKNIWQMTDDDMDFLFFYLRRDIWGMYFYNIDGKDCTHVGHEDFLHAMCALHRGNRYNVTFKPEHRRKTMNIVCYRYNAQYHPLYKSNCNMERFNAYIPDEWITNVEKAPIPENRYVETGKEQWWENIEQYTEKT